MTRYVYTSGENMKRIWDLQDGSLRTCEPTGVLFNKYGQEIAPVYSAEDLLEFIESALNECYGVSLFALKGYDDIEPRPLNETPMQRALRLSRENSHYGLNGRKIE